MSQQVNLFNPVFLKKEKHFSALTMLQVLGVILVACILLSVYAGYRAGEMKTEEAAAAARVKTAQADLVKIVGDPAAKNNPIEAEIRDIEAEIKSLQALADTMSKNGLANTEGYSEYLRAFARQIVAGVWLTGFTISESGTHISLQGRALQPELIPVFVAKLKTEPSMAGKTFSTLEMKMPDKTEASKAQVAAAFVDFSLHSERAADGVAGAKR